MTAKKGRPCWPCIIGGMAMMVALAGAAYLVLDNLF
jgi:hypothetical protein